MANVGDAGSFGIGQMTAGRAPEFTVEAAKAEAWKRLCALNAAFTAISKTTSKEESAHRALVFANLAGEFTSAAYNLQRTMYAEALPKQES